MVTNSWALAMVLSTFAALELAAWTASVRCYGRPVRAATHLDRLAMFVPVLFAISIASLGVVPAIFAGTMILAAAAYAEQLFIMWLLPSPAPRIRSVFGAWREAIGRAIP